ncbi:transcriptional regulator with XRE-family HTH domain [Kribbella aluminosa]|uniref:Transcriptional regulator with XRE-family HTH domain n=1 Tax=Kribbella aluminosa TaxID=416017 RepID=A0ABS4UX47_9ACTN|nr:hypothetical protein [Kribbella aluminosa]MBP2356225.1 transcriptional regulator with XRE-family HTH domain [Kribbella aluminosa]
MVDREPNRLLRKARGSMTQRRLADLVSAEIYNATGKKSVITAKSISDWECGLYTWPPAHVRTALCRVLQEPDPSDLGFFNKRRVSAPKKPEVASLVDLMAGQLPAAGSMTLRIPDGRSFSGVDVEAHRREAVSPGDGWLMVDPGPDAVLNRPDRRSFVIAVDDMQQSCILDGRRFANRVGRRTGPQPVSSATSVDDLTVGVIWAVTNTDVALLADDSHLSTLQAELAPHDRRCLSDMLLTGVPMLTPVASQWLRSWLCTRHISRKLERLSGQPYLWPLGRRGEDATSWLLWRHRFEYLRHTSRWFPRMRHDFHVQESDVVESPMYERVLLLLAAALMEAFGIAVALSSECEPAEVLQSVPGDESIVANWLGASGLCCVDASAPWSCGVVSGDGAEQARELSPVTEQSSECRLEAIANRLDVSWPWFQRRCAELAPEGVDDIAHPRSRLLSTRGLNSAVRYIARAKNL